ncbi:F0F1 ATP synthase subunit B [Mycolicibacterium vaccae]|uniref:F0F1 ATP synthase subunit B n=1 Tax=Mycolicibacterium vaccae TaxID=1810 RepID=UPI003CFD2BA0
MGDLTAAVLAAPAADESEGTGNFLLPNGTFFVVLLIFLVVLAVIAKWVVPPVSKVLAEREAMLAKTAADNREAAKQLDAAQEDYNKAMAGARGEAAAMRDEARSEGRQVVDQARAEAGDEVANKLQSASDTLEQTAATTTTQLESSVDDLSKTLASRILGVDVNGTSSERR